jgi:hypothetical protein
LSTSWSVIAGWENTSSARLSIVMLLSSSVIKIISNLFKECVLEFNRSIGDKKLFINAGKNDTRLFEMD